MEHWGAMGKGSHCHYVGIDETLGCNGGGALIVTVCGLMEHWGAMGEGLSLSLSLCED